MITLSTLMLKMEAAQFIVELFVADSPPEYNLVRLSIYLFIYFVFQLNCHPCLHLELCHPPMSDSQRGRENEEPIWS